jgi:hypothetical protein
MTEVQPSSSLFAVMFSSAAMRAVLDNRARVQRMSVSILCQGVAQIFIDRMMASAMKR